MIKLKKLIYITIQTSTQIWFNRDLVSSLHYVTCCYGTIHGRVRLALGRFFYNKRCLPIKNKKNTTDNWTGHLMESDHRRLETCATPKELPTCCRSGKGEERNWRKSNPTHRTKRKSKTFTWRRYSVQRWYFPGRAGPYVQQGTAWLFSTYGIRFILTTSVA